MGVFCWVGFAHFAVQSGLKQHSNGDASVDIELLSQHVAFDHVKSLCATSVERDCPLNLSISLSGEKENNNDS